MNRRTLLSRLAGLGAVTVAGCVDDANPGPAGTGTPTTDPPTTDPPTTDPPTTGEPSTDDGDGDPTSDDGDPTSDRFSPDVLEHVATVELGSRDQVAFPGNNEPVTVHVWNDADEERPFEVRVTATDGDEEHVERRTLPADAYLTVVLNVPSEYTVGVGTDGEVRHEFPAGFGDFDCNTGYTALRVLADWSVETSGLSTDLGCFGPAVNTSRFGISSADCASIETSRATVAFEGESVAVDGSFVTPTPCYGVEFEEPSYDQETDTFVVTVARTDPDDEMCVECVGQIDYQVDVAFENDLPGHVVVRHRADGELTEVARATRNADVDLDAD
ncbi:hypothetical protein [Haloarchaeobius sp. HRN-SO-5]|uniref:hypothetical protein n=1 Tax=Haloarchaeobius sp. HRN-SO-5 TaxID=3446118 RepID=UPI003EB74C68